MKVHDGSLKMVRIILAIYFIMAVVALPAYDGVLKFGTSVFGLISESSTSIATDSGISTLVRRGDTSPSHRTLLINALCFGVPATLCFTVRLVNRAWVMHKLYWDDYAMMVTFCFYAFLVVLINVAARFATNLYPEIEAAGILSNPADIERRILGSKIVVAQEQCMLFATWGVKYCIWGFQRRCCRHLGNYERVLWWLLGYITVTLVSIEISYFFAFCRPFSQYWAVPVENTECATYATYSIIQAVFNTTSDAILIAIPVHMVWISSLHRTRKWVAVAVFSLGIFTIIAAILNKVFNFKSPFTTTYQLWYLRESSVAICVSNIICTWQLIQRLFNVRSWDNKDAGIQRESEQLGVNGTVPRTFGGTPRVSGLGLTPEAGFRARFIKRRDPDASLMEETIMTGSAVNVVALETIDEAGEEKVAMNGSTDTSGKLSVDNPDYLILGTGARFEGEPGGDLKSDVGPATQLMTLDRDGDDATLAVEYRSREDIH